MTNAKAEFISAMTRATLDTSDLHVVAERMVAEGWRPPLPPTTGDAKADLVELLNVSHDEAQGWHYWNFGHGADTILAAGWLPPTGPLPEWCCPACGETTRARLADKAPPSLPIVRTFRYTKPGGPVYRAYPDGRVTRNGEDIPADNLAHCEAAVRQGAMTETAEPLPDSETVPTSRVVFPGDHVPAGTFLVGRGAPWFFAVDGQLSQDADPQLEIPLPTPAERKAAIDRARAEREADHG